jgi:hypothetical protein
MILSPLTCHSPVRTITETYLIDSMRYGSIYSLRIGFAVTKKTFNGQIDKIEPFFLEMVNKLCRMVFEQDLQPKVLCDFHSCG